MEKHRYRERRKAIKNHWAQKSSKLKARPRVTDTTNISIRINDSIIRDQRNAAEVFGDYFSTMPNEIGGQHVPQLGEKDLKTHVGVEAIRHS